MATSEGETRDRLPNSEYDSDPNAIRPTPGRRTPSPEPPSSMSLLDTSRTQTPNVESKESDSIENPHQPAIQSRSLVPAYLVAGYATLSIFAWITTCVMTYRPLWPLKFTKQYVMDYQSEYNGGNINLIRQTIEKNRDWYQRIRVLQSVIAVLTLPLTTSVMSAAAVIYVQRSPHDLSLRQLIALADKSWTDAIAVATTPGGRHKSPFLVVAIAVYILGGLLSPLQESFLSVLSKKVTYSPGGTSYLADIPEQFKYTGRGYREDNSVVLITRGLLETTSSSQPQAQLWQGSGYACSDSKEVDGKRISEACRFGTTLEDIAQLEAPFLAQLPAGYSTGLIRQFIPRINSTTDVALMTAEDFPRSCETMPGSFWASYFTEGGGTSYPGYPPVSIQICMPGNLTTTPWKRTRDRQTFTENLYLNISFEQKEPKISYWKISMSTTAGYFQLPNEWNQTAGELLDKDPFGPEGACHRGCEKQISVYNDFMLKDKDGGDDSM
ncbi:hypothetical protein GQ607_001081 [Colletotrichum asianum]|uniref:Uncharacterized protein n=1 Tax=Colletotrichum asianum TaxID=702518 RepID=A0A8H3ZXM3_9PEZI|nr:hypothetical protein GQ607_001081 [Colletotrichum asianum]